MPRRNKTPKHQPYTRGDALVAKKRYASRQSALNAIKEQQKYHLDLQLSVYQLPGDSGWYLTSSKTEQS